MSISEQICCQLFVYLIIKYGKHPAPGSLVKFLRRDHLLSLPV